MCEKSFETKLQLINNIREKTELGYNVNSFHRFGDDLCELIISYLTIKEKIVFESVLNNGSDWSAINRQF